MATKVAQVMVLHALTPLHPGSGQSTGIVDLPVQREVHTQFPMVAASGVKGSLRDLAETRARAGEVGWTRDVVETVFGPETANASEGAGALSVTDLRILAFPVRSLQAVFVWVTCPLVLRRLQRDLNLAGKACPDLAVAGPSDEEVVIAGEYRPPLLLEERALQVRKPDKAALAAMDLVAELAPADLRDDLRSKLAIVSDQVFTYFVRHCTQVSARIALNERKTTTGDGGNLWYEETLPPETILYGLLVCSAPRIQRDGWKRGRSAGAVAECVAGLFAERPYIQIGGNETVGQGWCRVNLMRAGDMA